MMEHEPQMEISVEDFLTNLNSTKFACQVGEYVGQVGGVSIYLPEESLRGLTRFISLQNIEIERDSVLAPVDTEYTVPNTQILQTEFIKMDDLQGIILTNWYTRNQRFLFLLTTEGIIPFRYEKEIDQAPNKQGWQRYDECSKVEFRNRGVDENVSIINLDLKRNSLNMPWVEIYEASASSEEPELKYVPNIQEVFALQQKSENKEMVSLTDLITLSNLYQESEEPFKSVLKSIERLTNYRLEITPYNATVLLDTGNRFMLNIDISLLESIIHLQKKDGEEAVLFNLLNGIVLLRYQEVESLEGKYWIPLQGISSIKIATSFDENGKPIKFNVLDICRKEEAHVLLEMLNGKSELYQVKEIYTRKEKQE